MFTRSSVHTFTRSLGLLKALDSGHKKIERLHRVVLNLGRRCITAASKSEPIRSSSNHRSDMAQQFVMGNAVSKPLHRFEVVRLANGLKFTVKRRINVLKSVNRLMKGCPI